MTHKQHITRPLVAHWARMLGVFVWVGGAALFASGAAQSAGLERAEQQDSVGLQDTANAAPYRSALTVYGAGLTKGGIQDIPGFEAQFTNGYMGAVALSHELAQWGDWAAFEVEGQLAKHFGVQNHSEANALLVARWQKFPWDHLVNTSVAVGEGISMASSVPVIERERSPIHHQRFLNYILLELELAKPEEERWSFVSRIHHRSGVFGTYGGQHKGSNLLGAGVRYRF